mgnify:CR=1 FL=1
MSPQQVEIEIPVEHDGFVADVAVNYQFGAPIDRAKCLANMHHTKFSGERVYLEGSFEVADLVAILYFLDQGTEP